MMVPDAAMTAPAAHVANLRQSLQGCTSHSHGPVVAFGRVCEARRRGEISASEFTLIGMEIVATSRRRHEELTDQDREASAQALRREELVVEFATALFGL